MDELEVSVIIGYYMIMSSVYLQARQLIKENARKQRRNRRWWVRNIFQNRQQYGDSYSLVDEMILSDRESFYNYTRMTYNQFEKLLSIVGPHITKYSIRKSLPAKHRLLITLRQVVIICEIQIYITKTLKFILKCRFLATGMNYSSLSYAFRVSKSVVHNIIKETTEKIWITLHDEYLRTPDKTELSRIANKFFEITGMPHCVGAIDGKHCTVQAPPTTGSLYFNYKKQFSIILLAVCNADCNFIYANVGAYGSESDGNFSLK